tara:strand:- start:25 stop:819 length:795 start_codon:yes stop_codon:yes gene_type:complete
MDTYFYLSKILAPLLNFSNILFLIFFIFTFLFIFYRTKIIKNFFIILLLITLIITFSPIGNFLINYLERDFYSKAVPEKVDSIVVLAGAENGHNTFLHKKLDLGDASERLIAFVKLANKFPEADLIYLGGDPYLNNTNLLSEPEVAKIFFEDVNFKNTKIAYLASSRNTIENLSDLKKYTKFKNYKNTILITSASHMKRSLFIAEKLNLDLLLYPVDFKSSFNFGFVNSWQSFDIIANLTLVNIFWKEYLGIVAANITFIMLAL